MKHVYFSLSSCSKQVYLILSLHGYVFFILTAIDRIITGQRYYKSSFCSILLKIDNVEQQKVHVYILGFIENVGIVLFHLSQQGNY